MNISIKSFFLFLGIFSLLLTILIIINMNKLDTNNEELKQTEYNRFLMIQKANLLRQTSNDLTRFVRMYAVTLDENYKKNYFLILDIRNGKANKPKNYENIYWDLLEPLRSKEHPLGEKEAFNEEIRKLPYTKYELEKLEEAEENSNNLVNIEREAINAIKGLYKDKNGAYTIKSKADQQFAIQLLHSKDYDKYKEKIMYPIDKFLMSIDKRTKTNIESLNNKVSSNINSIYLIFFINVFILIISSILISLKILRPIRSLTKDIVKYQNGEKYFLIKNYYDDEIGFMTKQFHNMKNTLNEKYELIENMTITDELTNTYNRKFYNQKISELISLHARYQTPFSIIMFDIDNFKYINDTYGHKMGDEILIELSNLVKSYLRDTDYLFRVGGEEFIILLSETNIKEAKLVAEKIRKNVSELKVKTKQITISLGLTQILDNDTEELIYQRVDGLLYYSKKNGKNKITTQIVGDVKYRYFFDNKTKTIYERISGNFMNTETFTGTLMNEDFMKKYLNCENIITEFREMDMNFEHFESEIMNLFSVYKDIVMKNKSSLKKASIYTTKFDNINIIKPFKELQINRGVDVKIYDNIDKISEFMNFDVSKYFNMKNSELEITTS